MDFYLDLLRIWNLKAHHTKCKISSKHFFVETLIKMYNNHVVAHADTFMQLTVLTDSKRVTCNKTITLQLDLCYLPGVCLKL